MNYHKQFKLPAYLQEAVETNLKNNINSRFQEFISKPKIAVKSFAKVNHLEKQETKNILKYPGKTRGALLKNVEAVINAVAGGDNIQSGLLNNLQDPVDVGKVIGDCENNKNSSIKSKRIKRMSDDRVGNNHNIFTDIPLEPNFIFSKTSDMPISPEEIIHHNLSEETEKHINESIYCDLCNETFKNSVDFCLHSIKHNQKYTCHVCEYKTILKKSIERHVRAHERKTLYNCEICKKGFTNNGQAIAHKNLHTGQKPFICDICGKAFGSSSMFSQHRRDSHWKTLGLTPPMYDCKLCDKKYTSTTGLKNHFKRHHVQDFDESELCDVCGKRLSSKEKLKFHRRIHTGYKPFTCNVCSKRFSKKEQLREHSRVHSGEKPYKCKHCSKGFTQRSSLKIHERIHTGERPYICRLCNKGFISKGVLDLHLKRCDGVSEDLN